METPAAMFRNLC